MNFDDFEDFEDESKALEMLAMMEVDMDTSGDKFKDSKDNLQPPVDLQDHKELEEESQTFLENLIISRQNPQRLQPWYRALPLRQIVLTTYRALAQSENLKPFQLLGLGKTLMTLLNEQITFKGLNEGLEGTVLDQNHKEHLEILESIFCRLVSTLSSATSTPRQDVDLDVGDIKQFLDSVWELHTNGTLDLSKTAIPANFIHSSPSRLDQVLNSCLDVADFHSKGSKSPLPLIPLCAEQPQNFLKVMDYLKTQYINKGHQGQQNSQILAFATEFQSLLKTSLCSGYYSLFPCHFHPFLYFVNAVNLNFNTSLSSKGPKSSKLFEIFENEAISSELLNLVDKLFHSTELYKFSRSSVIFLLYTVPSVPLINILKKRNNFQCNLEYRKWPWLNRAIRTEEFRDNFSL